LAKRTAAVFVATLVAVVAASAHADDQAPNTFKAHGVSFSYPGAWIEIPATYQIQIGTPLWMETVGPAPQPAAPAPGAPAQPSPTPQPSPPRPDLVTLAAFHLSVSLTKKDIARYKNSIALSISRLAAQAHGQLLSGPIRVSMGRLPGYRFELTVQLSDGTMLQNRVVVVFRKKTEYFLNCQHPQNDPLTAEIDGGCDQIMQSFRRGL